VVWLYRQFLFQFFAIVLKSNFNAKKDFSKQLIDFKGGYSKIEPWRVDKNCLFASLENKS
jgi:hypothetical protein